MDGFLFKFFLVSCIHSLLSLHFFRLFIPWIFSFAKNFKKKDISVFSVEQNFPPANQKAGTSSRLIILRKYKTGISPFLPNACLILSQKPKYVNPAQSSQGPFCEKWYANKGEKNFYFLKKLIKKRKVILPLLPNLFSPAFHIPDKGLFFQQKGTRLSEGPLCPFR